MGPRARYTLLRSLLSLIFLVPRFQYFSHLHERTECRGGGEEGGGQAENLPNNWKGNYRRILNSDWNTNDFGLLFGGVQLIDH
jgi:hypothetical protein